MVLEHFCKVPISPPGVNGVWKVKDAPIKDDQEYKIAISSYLVEKGDTNLGFLTYGQGEMQKVNVDKKDFFQVVIDQFKIEFP